MSSEGEYLSEHADKRPRTPLPGLSHAHQLLDGQLACCDDYDQFYVTKVAKNMLYWIEDQNKTWARVKDIWNPDWRWGAKDAVLEALVKHGLLKLRMIGDTEAYYFAFTGYSRPWAHQLIHRNTNNTPKET